MSKALLASTGYLGTVIGANYLTSHYGLVPVGFGLVATAGTYLVGASFVLRDSVQDTGGRRLVVLLVLIGALISAWFSPALAIASGVAFLLSELADMAIYTPLRSSGYIRAAIASNLVGAVIDTYVFLWLAGFSIAAAPGQMVGKLWITLAVVVLVVGVRAVLRKPVHA